MASFQYHCIECDLTYDQKDHYMDHLVVCHNVVINSEGRPQEKDPPSNSLPPKKATKGRPLWSKPETIRLIDEYTLNLSKFKDPKSKKGCLWTNIASKLGFGYTGQQCEGRWKTLVAGYKRASDHNNKSGNNAVKYEYEDELRTALGEKRNVNPSHILNSQDPESFGINQPTSSKRPSLTREALLNISGDPDQDEPDELHNVVKKRKVPKKDDLLSWLKENEGEQRTVLERHHRESIDVMKELIGVLKDRTNSN